MARNALFRLLPLLLSSTIVSGIVTPRATCSNGKTVSSAEVREHIISELFHVLTFIDSVASGSMSLKIYKRICTP